MSTPWPEPTEGPETETPVDGEEGCDPQGDLSQELDQDQLLAAMNDPYARVHESLDRSARGGEVPRGWHLTDFVVIAAAESARPELREQTLMLYVGPKDELAPHRVMGLLDYARQRYNHGITCCRCGSSEIDVDDDETFYDPPDGDASA